MSNDATKRRSDEEHLFHGCTPAEPSLKERLRNYSDNLYGFKRDIFGPGLFPANTTVTEGRLEMKMRWKEEQQHEVTYNKLVRITTQDWRCGWTVLNDGR